MQDLSHKKDNDTSDFIILDTVNKVNKNNYTIENNNLQDLILQKNQII